MELLMLILIPILAVIGLLSVIDFLVFLLDGTRTIGIRTQKISETLSVLIAPWMFLSVTDIGKINDCCSEIALFSPDHRMSIYILILLCQSAYFYSSYRKKLAPPVLELAVNCLLLTGTALNIIIAIQISETAVWLLGNVSITAFFLSMLLQNHHLLINDISERDTSAMNAGEKIVLAILKSKFFLKYPVLLVLCLPILALLAAALFLVGQKPDSFVRAFTDTYKQGLSQLNYVCDNVQCGGHYLCSVAANGHKGIVKPIRLGERNGNPIICNRQLLISNAFEELIEQRFPRIHRVIRKNYDSVGDIIHKNYNVFNNKYFSDFIYLAMKPAEWLFLIILYIADKKPENRIAQQYLKRTEKGSPYKYK